jgi:hypothetical protein
MSNREWTASWAGPYCSRCCRRCACMEAAMPAPPWTATADRTALVERVQALEAAREERDRSLVGMTEERDLWRGLYEGQRRCGDRLMGERDELRDRLDEAHVERDTARRERDIHKQVADEAIARLREYEDERRDARKGLR